MRSTTDTESQLPVGPPETLNWHRFTEKDRKSRVNWGSHFTVLVGIIMAIGSATIHIYSLMVAGIAIAVLFLPFYFRPSRRLEVQPHYLALRRQRPWRNVWLWIAFVTGTAAVALVVESTTGETDPRPRIIGLAMLAIPILSGTQAYKLRGPLRIGGDSIAQAKYVVPLHGATVDVNEGTARSPAAVRITPAPGATDQLSSYAIDPWNYGLDVNTVASALTQIVRWLDAGRTASPPEILSMLTVAPPPNVPLGASMDLPLVLTSQTGGTTRSL